MERRGSQFRDCIKDTDYVLVERIDENEVVLAERANGKRELWIRNDDYAGYVIVIDGQGYEFVRTAKMGDLWWAGIQTTTPAKAIP